MDNHPFGSPYPYGSYGYPPHPQVPPHPHQPYPPPYPQPHQPYPPPQQPYPPPQQPYPPASSTQYPPSAPAPNPYPPYPHYPPPPSYSTPPTDSYSSAPSAPPAFSHEPPPPHEHQHSHSGSFSYPNQGYPVLEQQNSLKYETMPTPDSFHRHNSSVSLHSSSVNYGDSKIQSYPSVYPPIDYLLENVHLSSNEPSPSVSEVPKPTVKYHSGPLPGRTGYNGHQGTIFGQHHNHNHSFNSQGTMYGYTNSSFSSYESSPSRVQSSSPSPNRLSLDIIPSNHALGIVPVSPKGSLKVLLLHGNLDIWVCEAKNLPNMDMFHKTLGDVLNKLPGNMTGKIEGHMNHKITSDPYVTITLCDAAVGRTYVISNDENPVWMQHFNVPVAHYAAEIHFLVKDNDVVGSQLIGIVAIPVEKIFNGERLDGFYPILGPNGKPIKPGAVLRVSIQYAPIEKPSIYYHRQGVGGAGVPGSYFPLRKGGRVTLYQDAHVPDGYPPSLKLGYGNGMDYVHGKCWQDIFKAIRKARRLIYITGWSFWPEVRLIRYKKRLPGRALGELLNAKSKKGVRVLLLVWDDPTSISIFGQTTTGKMATHDEETRRFFKDSSVHIQLCLRAAGKCCSLFKHVKDKAIYTHHQKTVIVDVDAGNNMRRIVSFVGGLDLFGGRYDTPNHSLFRTLKTLHAGDYHNPTYKGEDVTGCPRQPWHDLHCKIDGPAAYDVLENFERRWQKAWKQQRRRRDKLKEKLKGPSDDPLLRIEQMPDIFRAADTPFVPEYDPECWHVQVFRSIDSNSVEGFPEDPKKATAENLMCGKNVVIDMSIHTAYVKAIRAAQRFIYIENQYFIGSSYNWETNKDTGANNLIPMEIALKIAEKIKARERFAVYILVPMWPEGNPTGFATQRILFWQHKTMQMMYETIYKALVETGLEDTLKPEDYLNFYCLGNREKALDNDSNATTENHAAASGENKGSSTNTPQDLSRKSRRFMIYVHSKGMIVDDEYVILGSANINQRSMEGTRDTEIAMGGYQPHHTWARHSAGPRGQIYGYRMSLWAEHLGVIEDCFRQPESLECVRRTRSMGKKNWKQFASPEVTEMSGHLCKYPVKVDRTGKVIPLPGHETFPDVGGNIIGTFFPIKENITI